MKIHLIAIGGSIMHNLAIALHMKGYELSGSDDEIFNPAREMLEKHALLPEKEGWDTNRIHPDLDAVIVGMHARENNPELKRAKQLNLKVYSFPEYVFEQTKDKKRVVIGGSHGKTTITSMIMHVLKFNKLDFDYLVGSRLEGFETMVKLTESAPVAIFEGDEYLSSPIDSRPKFHVYEPNIGLISGIAWDHINVFPSYENYLDQFRIFITKIQSGGSLIYQGDDPELKKLIQTDTSGNTRSPYYTHPYEIVDNKTYLLYSEKRIPVMIFGKHNMQNLQGAKTVCSELGLTDEQFYEAIKSFKGAARRLQILKENENTCVYFDFAHSPSKVKATIDAVKEQYPERELISIFELHTFSSLKEDFLPEYKDTLQSADKAFVYYSPDTLIHKKLKEIKPGQVRDAFGTDNIRVFTNPEELKLVLQKMDTRNRNFLIMTSGNFSGIDFSQTLDI